MSKNIIPDSFCEEGFFNRLGIGKNVDAEGKIKLEKILDRAYGIRALELDLYWKRATYFWGLMIATFTAYFIAQNPTYQFTQVNIFLVICLGYVFSLA